MRILLSGSTGLIGRALGAKLESGGHHVAHLVRSPTKLRPGTSDLAWHPDGPRVNGTGLDPTGLDPTGLKDADLEQFDTVVHLAGAGIGDKRWNSKRKQTILDSRVVATRVLAGALAGLPRPPSVFVVASAIGYYGDRDDEILTEESKPGKGFLAQLCREWESSSAALDLVPTRVAHLRTGIVQSTSGGALARQLPLFKAGLGARLGSGRQWMSWITLRDEVAAILHVLGNETLSGPINLVAPEAVTNAAYTRSLARALHRPAPLSVPSPLLGLALGSEMAGELLLSSQRVKPAKLTASGFEFAHPHLDHALEQVLAKPR